ncbi:MAG: ornithine cyclodeaminase family protein [Saprospiraceae bacterium]|nr:ornithine cyclodeaminase family protein [Saprospiraceae bacterium]
MVVISNNDLQEILDFPDVIRALGEGFRGSIVTPQRHHHDMIQDKETNTLLLMPAWQRDYLGVKLVVVNPANNLKGLPSIQGNYLLYNAQTGVSLAMFEAGLLTNIRTAAASALASSYLSRKNSRRLLMIGTGSLAPFLVRAHSQVRTLDSVVIWGRRLPKARDLVHQLKDLALDIKVGTSLTDELGRADIISVATLSENPLVLGEYLKPGQHVDLVGSYKPNMREADDECIRRCSIYIDTEQGIVETGDLIQPIRKGTLRKSMICGDLYQLCRGERKGRRTKDEITLFKSVGHASEDLSTAILAYEKVIKRRGKL